MTASYNIDLLSHCSAAEIHSAVDLRIFSLHGKLKETELRSSVPASIAAISIWQAVRPILPEGSSTVVSGGEIIFEYIMLSKPMTDTSPGTEILFCVSAWMTPNAVISFMEMMAVYFLRLLSTLNRPLSSRQVKKGKLRHEDLVPVSKGSQAL